jgi:hypothetical protein
MRRRNNKGSALREYWTLISMNEGHQGFFQGSVRDLLINRSDLELRVSPMLCGLIYLFTLIN